MLDNPDSPSFQASVGERLRTWRRSRRLTQEAAAVSLAINPVTYRKYELGRMSPGAGVLAQVCKQGVNLNWLLTGQHHMLLRDEGEQYSTNNDLIDQLSASLSRLRAVDEEKFLMLCRGFLARSDEAGEHSILRMNTGPVTLFGEDGEDDGEGGEAKG